MQGELAQVQWVSLHMQGASFPLHPLPPCPNPICAPGKSMIFHRKGSEKNWVSGQTWRQVTKRSKAWPAMRESPELMTFCWEQTPAWRDSARLTVVPSLPVDPALKNIKIEKTLWFVWRGNFICKYNPKIPMSATKFFSCDASGSLIG